MSQITDETGNQVSLHAYYPFGSEATDSAQDAFQLKFTGHERDENGGGKGVLDYMHARHCSPVLGRFLAVDPVGRFKSRKKPQRWNRYSYTANNPMRFVDPNGEDLTIVYDFSDSGLPAKAQTQIVLRVRGAFRRAGVRNVQSLFKGGSVKPRVNKGSDRVVFVRFTKRPLKDNPGAFGVTGSGSNRATVSTGAQAKGKDAKVRFLANVAAHEVGHASRALPKYSNDAFPIGSFLNPEGAEAGTIMQQGVPADVLGERERDFSAEDARQLMFVLNDQEDHLE